MRFKLARFLATWVVALQVGGCGVTYFSSGGTSTFPGGTIGGTGTGQSVPRAGIPFNAIQPQQNLAALFGSGGP